MNRIKINPLRGTAIVILTIAMPLSFLVSCIGEKKDIIEYTFDPQTSYTLKETNVITLVSDSGITRYKLEAATWLMFGKASEPYQYFPDGLYLEKFDTLFNIEASIKTDTAYYYERRRLWEANGNVDISNLKGERFRTSQLFWDENKKIVYSDSFIHISREDGENSGFGFTSNEDFTEYKIYKAKASIPVNMQRNTNDSIPQDSLNNETMPSVMLQSEQDSILSD